MSEPLIQYFLQPDARALGIEFGRPRDGDGGFDLPAREPVSIAPGGFELIPTGVHLAIPKGWVGLIRDRSSVALKGGATTAGVIDSGYRGEIKVAMHNLGKSPLRFAVGERVAQCIIVQHLSGAAIEGVEKLEALGVTDRGAAGFGSTGR